MGFTFSQIPTSTLVYTTSAVVVTSLFATWWWYRRWQKDDDDYHHHHIEKGNDNIVEVDSCIEQSQQSYNHEIVEGSMKIPRKYINLIPGITINYDDNRHSKHTTAILYPTKDGWRVRWKKTAVESSSSSTLTSDTDQRSATNITTIAATTTTTSNRGRLSRLDSVRSFFASFSGNTGGGGDNTNRPIMTVTPTEEYGRVSVQVISIDDGHIPYIDDDYDDNNEDQDDHHQGQEQQCIVRLLGAKQWCVEVVRRHIEQLIVEQKKAESTTESSTTTTDGNIDDDDQHQCSKSNVKQLVVDNVVDDNSKVTIPIVDIKMPQTPSTLPTMIVHHNSEDATAVTPKLEIDKTTTTSIITMEMLKNALDQVDLLMHTTTTTPTVIPTESHHLPGTSPMIYTLHGISNNCELQTTSNSPVHRSSQSSSFQSPPNPINSVEDFLRNLENNEGPPLTMMEMGERFLRYHNSNRDLNEMNNNIMNDGDTIEQPRSNNEEEDSLNNMCLHMDPLTGAVVTLDSNLVVPPSSSAPIYEEEFPPIGGGGGGIDSNWRSRNNDTQQQRRRRRRW